VALRRARIPETFAAGEAVRRPAIKDSLVIQVDWYGCVLSSPVFSATSVEVPVAQVP
jgi:hypothetical protein